MTIYVQIATPAGPVWEGSAQSVILPSSDGDTGILSGHIPMTLSLKFGILRIRVDGWQWVIFFVREGFAQVEEDVITILVNSAERSEYIDLQSAQTELAMAQASLTQPQSNGKKLLAARALQIAQTRLKAAEASLLTDKTRELVPK